MVNVLNKIEWYINAKPYRYICYSLVLNLFESVVLLVIFVKCL